MQARPTAWGKFTPPGSWLPLAQHMDDVAGCFAALIRLPLFRARSFHFARSRAEQRTSHLRESDTEIALLPVADPIAGRKIPRTGGDK